MNPVVRTNKVNFALYNLIAILRWTEIYIYDTPMKLYQCLCVIDAAKLAHLFHSRK